ncbi:MAG: hypothetical protein QM739_04050 [Propionivibrio sp.]
MLTTVLVNTVSAHVSGSTVAIVAVGAVMLGVGYIALSVRQIQRVLAREDEMTRRMDQAFIDERYRKNVRAMRAYRKRLNDSRMARNH